MQISPITPRHAAMTSASARESGGDFAAALAGSGARLETGQAERELREAAGQLISSAFLLPLLQQARENPLGSDRFHGGVGEDLFAAQLDTLLADRVVERSRLPLVDMIVERYLKPAGRSAGETGLNLHG